MEFLVGREEFVNFVFVVLELNFAFVELGFEAGLGFKELDSLGVFDGELVFAPVEFGFNFLDLCFVGMFTELEFVKGDEKVIFQVESFMF